MTADPQLTKVIDNLNRQFTTEIKSRLRDLSVMSDAQLEWLTMEHYQFSFANKGFLAAAIESTKKLSEQGVSAELLRNYTEEDGHAPMYKKGMMEAGTDFDAHAEFAPTTYFLAKLTELCSSSPSRVLGTLYATETAAIFEHEVFFSICHEICQRRGAKWEGSTIKKFHDIHLDEGVEQGHKDGLATFVDSKAANAGGNAEPIDRGQVLAGAKDAIEAMQVWWNTILAQVGRPDERVIHRRVAGANVGLGLGVAA